MNKQLSLLFFCKLLVNISKVINSEMQLYNVMRNAQNLIPKHFKMKRRKRFLSIYSISLINLMKVHS